MFSSQPSSSNLPKLHKPDIHWEKLWPNIIHPRNKRKSSNYQLSGRDSETELFFCRVRDCYHVWMAISKWKTWIRGHHPRMDQAFPLNSKQNERGGEIKRNKAEQKEMRFIYSCRNLCAFNCFAFHKLFIAKISTSSAMTWTMKIKWTVGSGKTAWKRFLSRYSGREEGGWLSFEKYGFSENFAKLKNEVFQTNVCPGASLNLDDLGWPAYWGQRWCLFWTRVVSFYKKYLHLSVYIKTIFNRKQITGLFRVQYFNDNRKLLKDCWNSSTKSL